MFLTKFNQYRHLTSATLLVKQHVLHWLFGFISLYPLNGLISQPLEYVATFTTEAIHVDGLLNEDSWLGQSESSLFVDIEGDLKPRPRHDTHVKILWNDQYLFVGATLYEPRIQSSLLEKNSYIFHHDNNFEVFIDPDGDNCNYYELELNAFNTIWELSLPVPYRNGGKPIDPDNMDGMISAVAVYGSVNDDTDVDSMWTVEIAFPLTGFDKYDAPNTPPEPGDYWRINFSRVEWQYEFENGVYTKPKSRKEDNWVWSPQLEINMHAPEKWGYVHFQKDGSSVMPVSILESKTRTELMNKYRWLYEYNKLHDIYPSAESSLISENIPSHMDYFKTASGYDLNTSIIDNTDNVVLTVNQSSCLSKQIKGN